MDASKHAGASTGDQLLGGNDSVAATNDPSYSLATYDGRELDQDKDNIQVCSTRKCQRTNFPLSYTRDRTKGDLPRRHSRRQCVVVCKKLFLVVTNAQGWEAQLKTQHHVPLPVAGNSNADMQSTLSLPVILHLQQTIKGHLPPHVVQQHGIFENAIVAFSAVSEYPN